MFMVVGLVILMAEPKVGFLMYTVGVLAYSAVLLQGDYTRHGVVVRRLYGQRVIGCGFLLAAAVLLSMQVYRYGMFQRNEWVVALAIGTVLQLYTAWRLPSELEKESRKK